MKVSDYIPKLYNKNLEMTNIINSEEEEFENNLKPNIDNSFRDTFPVIATEKGIENYEKIFSILPDKETESLEERRQRIIYRLNSHIPYTLEALIIQLDDILGHDNYTIDYDFENALTLEVTSLIPGRLWYTELIQVLDQMVPCNIDWSVEIYSATWQLVMDNYSTWQDIYDTDMTWQELMDAEWL